MFPINKTYPSLLELESFIKQDMSLKLSGLQIDNLTLGSLPFDRVRLCNTPSFWCLEGLLFNYSLPGWFSIVTSNLPLPLCSIHSSHFHSPKAIRNYCRTIIKHYNRNGVLDISLL